MGMTAKEFKEYLKKYPDYSVEKEGGGDAWIWVNTEEGYKVFVYQKAYNGRKADIYQIAGEGVPSYKEGQTFSSSYGEDIHQALLRDEKRNKNDQ